MESTLFILLVTIAALGLALVLFCGWLILAAFKGAARLGARAIGADGQRAHSTAPTPVTCPRKRCHADNPPGARFCRRCGIALPTRTAPGASPRQPGVW